MIAEIIKVGKTVKAIPKKLVLFIIKCYQVTISPDHSLFLKKPGGYCRYFPSCSQYCYEAVDRRGAVSGLLLGFWRVLRCNPWSGGGFDPVPGKNQAQSIKYQDSQK